MVPLGRKLKDTPKLPTHHPPPPYLPYLFLTLISCLGAVARGAGAGWVFSIECVSPKPKKSDPKPGNSSAPTQKNSWYLRFHILGDFGGGRGYLGDFSGFLGVFGQFLLSSFWFLGLFLGSWGHFLSFFIFIESKSLSKPL